MVLLSPVCACQPAALKDPSKHLVRFVTIEEGINALKINSPVLVGHSMAGGELTTLANQHSDRLAGLVYLDALGDPRDWPASDPAFMALLRNLPAPMREPPSPPDFSSFAAYRDVQRRNKQGVFPE